MKSYITTGFCYIADYWKNGKFGAIKLDKDSAKFYPFIDYDTPDDEAEAVKVLDCGFYYDIIALNQIKASISVCELFNDVFGMGKEAYIHKHGGEPDAWLRDLGKEFLAQHYQEMLLLQNEEPPLFEYLCDDDVRLLKSYLGNYIKYLDRMREEADANLKQSAATSAATKPKESHKKTFDDYILMPERKDEIKEELHKIGDGKKGKDWANIVKAAMELGIISEPTHPQLTKEFGDIGNKAAYSRERSALSRDNEQASKNAIKERLKQDLRL